MVETSPTNLLAAQEPEPAVANARRLGLLVEVGLAAVALLLLGATIGDGFRFFALSPSPLLLLVLWGALRGGLLPALAAAVLAGVLHLLGVLVVTQDFAALTSGAVTWPLFAFVAVAYVVGQARDMLAVRVAQLQVARVGLQTDTARQRRDIDVLEHANRELKRRIFDRSFDFESLVATVARSSLEHDEHMFEAPLEMLTNFCGAQKCSVLLVLADGTLDLAAHRGWEEAEIGPRLQVANHSTRVLRAIVEGRPVVELSEGGQVAGPLLIAPIADASGLIKVLVCIDEMAPARFEDGAVKTFLGIVSWLATNLRRMQLREATGDDKSDILIALKKTKHIGTVWDLSERIHLEDARRKRYGIETEVIAIRLLDMRVHMEDYVGSLETRLVHVLNTTVRLTDDIFEFGFSGCYVLLLTACQPGNGEKLVARLNERFAGCEGPDFGPVALCHFAASAEAPTLAALLPLLTTYFCSTSPMPLAQECPVPPPRQQRGGNAQDFARRLRLETDLAQRRGTELNMLDFHRDGPGLGVGPMIARHLWNAVGTLLRVTDGIYVLSPSRCVVLLPFTTCVDASNIWSRLNDALRANLPEHYYEDVRVDFLALDVKHLRETVEYLMGDVAAEDPDATATPALTENELQELSFSDGELTRLSLDTSAPDRNFRVLASSTGAATSLPSPEAMRQRWEATFQAEAPPPIESIEPIEPIEPVGEAFEALAAFEPARFGPELDIPERPSGELERELRVIASTGSAAPPLPGPEAMKRRWAEVFERPDRTGKPEAMAGAEPWAAAADGEPEPFRDDRAPGSAAAKGDDQQLVRMVLEQFESLRALLTHPESPAARPGRREAAVPASPGPRAAVDDPEILRLLLGQIEGLVGVCRRLASVKTEDSLP